MSRSMIPTIALAVSALLSVSTYAAGSDAAGKKGDVGTAAFSGGLKLQKTWFETANASGAALASGFNSYGSTLNVSCTNAAGCYIIVNANAQVGAISTVNPSAISIKVNGASINAPFNTPVSTSSFTVMSYQTGIFVNTGNHVVTTDVYVTTATTLYRYNTEVKLYKV